MGRRPHVLIVPFPAQGHVMPMMKLANQLSDRGVKVTFVNTEYRHAEIMAATPGGKFEEKDRIHLVSVPDGLEAEDNRRHLGMIAGTIPSYMPGPLEDVVRKIQESDEKLDCIIADSVMGWALEIAMKMGIKRASFYIQPIGHLGLNLQIPKLLEDGIVGNNGKILKAETMRQSPNLPTLDEIAWDDKNNRIVISLCLTVCQAIKDSQWVLTNSFYELDPLLHDLIPNNLPVGPLLSSNLQGQGQPSGSLWPEDSTCLRWLDKQPACSVIYVAFGSTTIFSQHQFDELALGLQLVGRPFLWVVRSDLISGSDFVYPVDGLAHGGMIVKWVPQEKVLAHPSISCFLTHCGWNSIIDAISMGVPFLGWPYMSDQFYVKRCITDIWKVGLGLDPEEDGIVSSHQIKSKLEKLLVDEFIRANALNLKETARKSIAEGGSSFKNFEYFIQQITC